MTAADCLTLLRLALVPFFLAAFLIGEFGWAFWLFVAAGITDLIDGSVARWLNHPTRFGAFLDPIADKALMVTTVSCLLMAEAIPLWFFLLVVFRDCSILLGLAWFRIKKVPFELKPVMASKVATLSNIILVVFSFLKFLKPTWLFLGQPFSFWFALFLGFSTFLIVVSGTQYFFAGIGILRKRVPHG